MADEYRSFEEFWPFYVKEHTQKANRVLHFAGTSIGLACLAGGLLTKRRWLLALAPVAGYGGAWIGHFFVEHNKPASWRYPLWSFRADFVMWWKIVRREMDAEVERVLAEQKSEAKPAEEQAASDGHATIQGETVN